MASIINCGKLDKNIIFPIISGISHFIYNFIFSKKKPEFLNYPFLISIGSSFDMCFSLILLIISNKRSKKVIKNEQYNETIKKKRIQKMLFISAIAIMDFSQTIFSCFALKSKSPLNFRILDFFTICIFAFFMLKIQFYKHQNFCIIIFIIIALTSIIKQIPQVKGNIVRIISDFILEMSFCFAIILDKYVMEYKFCSPYELCFYHGFICLILYGFTFIVFIIFKNSKYLNDFSEYYNNINNKETIIILAYMVFNFIYNISIFITNSNLNPFYILFTLIIREIEVIILDPKNNWELYINIVMIISLFLTTIIFNEIIEINCFGLEKNTIKNMERFASCESISSEREDSTNFIEMDGYKCDIKYNN